MAAAGSRPEALESYFEAQQIARDDLALESKVVKSGQEGDPALKAGGPHHRNGTHLRQSLGNEDTRHNGIVGKMAREEGLSNAHCFQTNRAFPGLKLDDAVDQQKREAVRNDLLDLDDA
jgi:hypothetical protein